MVDQIVAKKPLTSKIAFVPPVVVTKDNVTQEKDPMFGGTFTNPETFKPKK